jgi:alpha-methylacyl-CoA racemase
VLAHNLQALAAVATRGEVNPRGRDFLSGREPCYAVYRTKDGRHMAVGALEKKFWDAVCEVLERTDLKECHWEVGKRDAEWGRREMTALFASKTQAEWVARFANSDCCVTPVLTLQECAGDPQISARQMVVRHEGTLQFAPPLRMSDYRFEVERPAPAAGEHTDAILREAGYAQADIAGLRAAGVV